MLRSFLNNQVHGPNGSTIVRSALQSRDRLSWTNIQRRDLLRLHDHMCSLALLAPFEDIPEVVADIYDMRRILRIVPEPFPGHDAELSRSGCRLDSWLPIVYPTLHERYLDIKPVG